jgi:molybdate transport system regulatory protein
MRETSAGSFKGLTMAGAHLSIRIDLASGNRIGPGKIALLEAIRSAGSISGAARSIGMSYRRAWLLVEEINLTVREPAVTAETGGVRGGGAVVTPVGEQIIDLYRAIESQARSAAESEFRAIGKLIRHNHKSAE